MSTADLDRLAALTAPDAEEQAAEPEPDVAAAIAGLAALDRATYETRRREAAKRLGMRAKALDGFVAAARAKAGEGEPADERAITERLDPWPAPVDGAALAEEMRTLLRAHVVFARAGDADLAALWALGSYLMDIWALFPRLLIRSPTKACGKTTLLEVLEALTHRPVMAGNASPAALFRLIEAEGPTLLLDEADLWLRQSDDLAAILNSGHTRRTASVIRAEERNGAYHPKRFSTWAAIAVAGIGGQRDTLESRSIVIELRRRLPEEKIERKPADLFERCTGLRRRALRWAADNAARLAALDTDPPECGDDRMRDNFGPLFRLAEALGGPWPERVLAAYLAAAEEGEAEEPAGVMLLRDAVAFAEWRGLDKVPTAELVAHLATLADRPWPEWNRGKPITARGVAKLMGVFGVKPVNLRTGAGDVAKGYRLEDLEKALAPYTPSANPLHRYSIENKGNNADPIRYTGAACSGCEGRKTLMDQACSVVADTTGGICADAPSRAGSGRASLASPDALTRRVLEAVEAGNRSEGALAAKLGIPAGEARRLVERLRRHREEIARILAEDRRHAFEERAAILEFDPGLSRREAERRAQAEHDGSAA